MYNVQGDQLYITVCLWDLVKSDLSIVTVQSSVQWKSHFLQGDRKTPPCLSGRVVSICMYLDEV